MSMTTPSRTGNEVRQTPIARWTQAHLATLCIDATNTIPVIGPGDFHRVASDLDLWDMWPVQRLNGRTAEFNGTELWHVLSAPILPDPGLRHDVARIRLMTRRDGAYADCGDLLPDGFCPGSREWAGTAVLDDDDRRVTLFFTVSGRRREAARTFEQRLFQTTGTIDWSGRMPKVAQWSAPQQAVVPDGAVFVDTRDDWGRPGFIKGFRDPAFFRDPATGEDYLLFTGSLKAAQSAYSGAIGLARGKFGHGSWSIVAPLLSAEGVNNELERPHIIFHQERYYLLWSTQRHMFDPGGAAGPNGLYGMSAASLFGPYTPLNGSGLVAGNPAQEPYQSYSWWVLGDLSVVSFVDFWGLGGRAPLTHTEVNRAQFGGAPAPRFRLALDGDRAWIR